MEGIILIGIGYVNYAMELILFGLGYINYYVMRFFAIAIILFYLISWVLVVIM